MMEVSSSNKDFNEKEEIITDSESNTSKGIPSSNEKGVHERKDEENVEESLRDIACDAISVNNSYLANGIDNNKLEDREIENKETELKASNKSNGDNEYNNTEKLSKSFLNPVDSDSENEALEKTFSPNEEQLNIAKYKRNLKNKNAKRIRVIDSESEDDTENKINNFSETADKIINTTNGYQSLIDSESEEEKKEIQDVATSEKFYMFENKNINDSSKKKKTAYQSLIDSESEEEKEEIQDVATSENFGIFENKNTKDSGKKKKTAYQSLIDSESEEEKEVQNSFVASEKFEMPKNKSTEKNSVKDGKIYCSTGYQSLIDSDSDSEEEKEEMRDSVVASEKFDMSENKNTKKESIKKRKGSIRASKDEAMRQIHSETQRLLRETGVSLPYHKPKQRTLQEFLNRKRILPSLPKAPSAAAKLKMSSAIVSQVVAEKEREAELFYKSSDSEDDTQQPISFTARDIKEASITCKKMLLTDVKITRIQDSQKIDTNDQSIHNEGKIIQDDVYLDTSMSEKDFSKIDNQSTKDQSREFSLLTKSSNNHNDESNTSPQQIDNVSKQNLQKSGVSRKLFDTCFDSEINKDSDISRREQETERIVASIIASLAEEKHDNDEKKSEVNVTENNISEISQIYQCDSEASNIDRDKNLTAETMRVSKIPSNISNKEIAKISARNSDVIDDITSINTDDLIIIQDGNNEKRDKCNKTDISSTILCDTLSKTGNNSLTEESKDSDSHEFGLPFSKFVDDTTFVDDTLINRQKLLPKLIPNSAVTLKGSPGMIIDLTNDVCVKSYGKGVNTLLDRFFCKHVVNAKKETNDKSQETMVQNTPNFSSSDDLPTEELLPYKLPVNTDNSELNKPGAKLIRLKEDLKLHMTIKRNKEWKHKEKELREKEKEEWDEEEESDYHSDGQEKIHDLVSSDSGESEPEENDVCIKDKKRNKCLFADDEAEVTDNEDSSTDIEETCIKNDMVRSKCIKKSANFKCRKQIDSASEIETDQEEEKEEEDEEEEKEDENEENVLGSDIGVENGSESDSKGDDNINVRKNINIIRNKKDKETKQLIEESQDDLDITNSTSPENANNQLNNVSININTSETRYEENDLISENKSNMPDNQQDAEVVSRSQINKTPLTKTSMLDFVSPITQLSVFNSSLDSNKKERKEYLVDVDEKSMENTQYDGSSKYAYNVRNKNISKKKLFDDIKETVDDEYLMRLCSGKFGSTQKSDLDMFSEITNSKSQLCPENPSTKQLESLEIEDENSQNVKLILDEDSNNSVTHTKETEQVGEKASKLKVKIVSSDDDDQLDEVDTFLKSRKRSMKRLHLSDSEEESAQSSDEENDGMDKNTEEQDIDYDSEENEIAPERDIDYDSEENEIVPKKDIKKAAAGFLEEEAELSESDWDSADEDEKGLDKLEYEECDDEHIDEDEMKKQLERTYMKQMLDEDKREVRLLKELLFEDGDLHTDGTGRERKFKWRNIDKLGSNAEMSQASDENIGWLDVQEDEEEAKWSKLRQERDKFLEERMKCSNNEIEDELNSQIFKFGLEAIKKIKKINNDESQESYVSDNKIDSSENMEPIMPRSITDLLNGPNTGKKSQTIYNVIKKRSLLTRGEESLAKIASLAKQGDSASHTINARKFVFQYINPNNTSEKDDITGEDQDLQTKPRKRKVMSNFSSTTKKRRK